MGKMGKGMLKQVAAFTSIAGVFGLIIKLFKQFDAISGSGGNEFGSIGMKSTAFRENIEQSAPKMIGLGLSAADMTTSMTTLSSQFGLSLDQAGQIAPLIADY